jgi:hypothetical protein
MGTFVATRRYWMKQNGARSPTLQLRLSVKDVKPEIWRKLLVPSDITLARLHAALQVLMGWNDNHLYAFVIGGKRYSAPSEHDIGKQNSIGTKLSAIFVKDIKAVTYEYDYGDRWEIELCNEPNDDGFQQKQPTECIEGSRHGPVEDSGGSREYMEKVKIYGNPRHKRYQEVRDFIGPMFDPEAFDLKQTNAMLKELGWEDCCWEDATSRSDETRVQSWGATIVHLLGCTIAVAFTGSRVQFESNVVAVGLGDAAHTHSFGKILADEAVEVLVATPLPGMVRSREVALHGEALFECLVAMELRTVVQGDRLEVGLVLLDGGERGLDDRSSRSGAHLPNDHKAWASFHEGKNAVVQIATYHGISLPVPRALSGLHLMRPFRDMTLSGQDSSGILWIVALSTLFGAAAQMCEQRPSVFSVVEDVLVDRLVADTESSLQPEGVGDLLGTPLFLQ